jgi:hypothetical protein
MSWSASLILPLAALAMNGEPATAADGGSERFAQVLVTSYVCETLGFGVNYEGLADWGRAIQADMVAKGASTEAALAHIRRDVRGARDRFHELHGSTIQNIAAGEIFPVVNEITDEPRFRFQKRFNDRCKDLAAAADIGALFTAPERRLSDAELSRKTRAMYRVARGVSEPRRAPSP